MRISSASLVGSGSSLVAGIAVPIALPHLDPLVGKYLLVLAELLFALAAGLWWPGRKGDGDEGVHQTSHGSHSPTFGHVTGDVTITHASPPAMPPESLPYGSAHSRPLVGGRHPMIEHLIRNKYLDWDATLEVERQSKNRPQRDVALPEALAFAIFGEWGKTFYDAVTAGLVRSNEPLIRFRQLAHDGVLSAWGKRSENDIFQLIPKEHWLDHNVEWFDLLRGTARTEGAIRENSDPFLEIMVSRAQFTKEWPPSE